MIKKTFILTFLLLQTLNASNKGRPLRLDIGGYIGLFQASEKNKFGL